MRVDADIDLTRLELVARDLGRLGADVTEVARSADAWLEGNAGMPAADVRAALIGVRRALKASVDAVDHTIRTGRLARAMTRRAVAGAEAKDWQATAREVAVVAASATTSHEATQIAEHAAAECVAVAAKRVAVAEQKFKAERLAASRAKSAAKAKAEYEAAAERSEV